MANPAISDLARQCVFYGVDKIICCDILSYDIIRTDMFFTGNLQMADIDLKPHLYNGASEAIFVGDQNGNEVAVISVEELYRLYYCFGSVADTSGFSFDVAFYVNGNLLDVSSI